MSVALGVEKSLSGQAWRWRRPQSDEKLGTELLDELLLGRGVSPNELARYRSPTIRDLLPDQHLEPGLCDRIEAGKVRRDAVCANANRETIAASAISHGLEAVARGFVDGANDDTRQHPAGAIGNRAAQHGLLLREPQSGDDQHRK